MLQDPSSDYLPILLTISLSSVFHSNERPPSFHFQKACWDGFAFHFDSYCSSAEKYFSFSLSSAAALFTSLTLNMVKSSIPFGRIKRHSKPGGPLKRKKRLVKDKRLLLPLTEAIQMVRFTSPLPDVLRLSSPRLKLRHGSCSSLSPKSNPKSVYYLLRSTLLPLLITSPIVPLPGSRFWSSLIT